METIDIVLAITWFISGVICGNAMKHAVENMLREWLDE